MSVSGLTDTPQPARMEGGGGRLRSLEDAHIDELLHLVHDTKGSSDLHIAVGLPPVLRVDGKLLMAPYEAFTPQTSQRIVYDILTDEQIQKFESSFELDFSYALGRTSRFRVNVFRDKGTVAAAFRTIPTKIPTLADLNLPAVVEKLTHVTRGLILVTGPTGSGKSTTLAAMVNSINLGRSEHIITIEDPIEYLHPHKKCLVNQREVGQDTNSFSSALKYALREDPDVVLIGEMRDLETIESALVIAETGHLVFTTVHAGDCVGVIERLVSVFPAGEQDGVRRQLALVLRAVVAQQLLLADGPQAPLSALGRRRRVALSEVLLINPAVANLIATARSAQVYSAMEVGAMHGMQTFEQDLARLLVDGMISETTAYAFTKSPAVLKERVQRFKSNPALLRRPNPVPGKG